MSVRVRIDPTRCAGHAICALFLGERIDLDEWGFPAVDPTWLDDDRLARKARRAAAACPKGAIAVVVEDEPSPGGSRPRRAPLRR